MHLFRVEFDSLWKRYKRIYCSMENDGKVSLMIFSFLFQFFNQSFRLHCFSSPHSNDCKKSAWNQNLSYLLGKVYLPGFALNSVVPGRSTTVCYLSNNCFCSLSIALTITFLTLLGFFIGYALSLKGLPLEVIVEMIAVNSQSTILVSLFQSCEYLRYQQPHSVTIV